MLVGVSGWLVGGGRRRRGESGGHARMDGSVLGFVTWIPVHPTVGISTIVTWFNF